MGNKRQFLFCHGAWNNRLIKTTLAWSSAVIPYPLGLSAILEKYTTNSEPLVTNYFVCDVDRPRGEFL